MKRFILGFLCAAGGLAPLSVEAQWSTTHEQFYMPGSFNWEFRRNYPGADRLFNAFDYGHAILYERLWTKPNAPVRELEQKELDFITKKLLVNPPALPLEEAAIEVAYAKLAPEAKAMFEWAHVLHRQIYDVLADETMSTRAKDSKVMELIAYYKTRKDLAFSSLPKSMDLMEGQPYSLAFRKRYPKFNGLIWAYHWLQIGLYEPLLAGKNEEERQTGVAATVARFRQMIEQPPTWMPRVMPMTPAVAPLFTARYQEAAIIFDNLHSLHDVISDILANPSVRREQKRSEILKAARLYRDNTSFVVTAKDWSEMAAMMGIQNMGGPATGFLPGFPSPTVERGAVMTHTTPSGPTHMPGMSHGAPAPALTPPSAARVDHATSENDMAALHTRMMADSVIRARINSDPIMRELMKKAMTHSSATSPAHTHAAPAMKRKAAPVKAKPPTAKSKPKSNTKSKPKAKPKPDPMAGMDHSKMKH